jgi:hypothetical protein
MVIYPLYRDPENHIIIKLTKLVLIVRYHQDLIKINHSVQALLMESEVKRCLQLIGSKN